jgi:hypothetical protein
MFRRLFADLADCFQARGRKHFMNARRKSNAIDRPNPKNRAYDAAGSRRAMKGEVDQEYSVSVALGTTCLGGSLIYRD